MSEGTTAIETLLAGLIDYAGLYPPASLDMCAAAGNYRRYRDGNHAFALGRFIVGINKVDELRAAAGDVRNVPLSIIVPQPELVDHVPRLIDEGLLIEAIEIKCSAAGDIERITRKLPAAVQAYIEIPIDAGHSDLLRVISGAGARVKLRMGGVVPEAFPSSAAVARALTALVQAGLAFKATAGLHHPIRSRRRLTYATGSPSGTMHGFMNLISAVALLHFGADVGEAERALEEQDPGAWSLTPQALSWRSHSWSIDQLGEIRKRFFVSIGSCSFEVPIRDLETLRWL